MKSNLPILSFDIVSKKSPPTPKPLIFSPMMSSRSFIALCFTFHFSSVTQLCPTLAARQASLSIINSQSLLKLMSIELVMPSNHLILCRPLLLLPAILPSIRVFSNELALHIRWAKYWSFSIGISPSNEYSRMISFKIDWLNLLEIQGALKSLFLYHSSKESILFCSAIFMVQHSHPYMTTGKTSFD